MLPTSSFDSFNIFLFISGEIFREIQPLQHEFSILGAGNVAALSIGNCSSEQEALNMGWLQWKPTGNLCALQRWVINSPSGTEKHFKA